jgi:hypothetical protein
MIWQITYLTTARTSRNQKGISNNEQGMSNVEGKLAHKLHHSSFVIPCSIFKNYFLPENGKTLQQGNHTYTFTFSLLHFT